MSSRPLSAILVVALLAFAGCVASDADIDALAADAQAVLPHLELTDTHDHKDHAAHDIAWNAQRLGWNPIAEDVSKLGRYNHVWIAGDIAFVTAYALEKGAPGGLAVLDVSGDEPVLLSTLHTPTMTPIDAHATQDGRYVFIGGHRDARQPTLPNDAQTCTGTPAINVCTPFLPSGVMMIDVSDPSSPREVAYYASVPSGAHTVKVHEIGGEMYLFIASYGFSYANRLATSVEIARVNFDAPLGIVIEPVTRFFPSGMTSDTSGRQFVHDMWIEEHPLHGDAPLMYVSYWDGGVVVADVSDPGMPRELATWRDFDENQYGNIHFARPVGVIDGRHITMAAPEFGAADHAGEAYVLDTTDPASPKLLAKWTLPGDPVNDGGYRFSPHNIHVRGTEVVYAHYHGGVWVLDLAIPEEPQVKAYFFPTVPAETPDFEVLEDAPNVWTALWTERGTILASDIGTGLHHYGLTRVDSGRPPYEAFLR